MTSRTFIVELQKGANRATKVLTLQRQIDYVKERITSAGRDKRGWTVDSSRIEQRYNLRNIQDTSITNRCNLSIQCKPHIARAPQVYEHEFNNIITVIRSAVRAHKWQIARIDGKDPPADIVLNPSADDFLAVSTYVNVAIPDTWQDSFAHLYERDAHINIIHDAIAISIESQWKHRFHVLLYGPPGVGKTDITISVKDMVGSDSVLEFDATATTSAGAIANLNDREVMPRILLVEEIEKADENSLRWLLGVLDLRGNIRKLTYRGRTQRDTKMLCIATVNDMDLFRRMMSGALASRFSHQLYCPLPNRALLSKILEREVSSIDGNEDWIKPTLDYLDRNKITDPRKAIAICLTGRDRLLTGEFQKQMDATMEPTNTVNMELVRRLAR